MRVQTFGPEFTVERFDEGLSARPALPTGAHDRITIPQVPPAMACPSTEWRSKPHSTAATAMYRDIDMDF
jgi:hypothetical protein